MDMAFLLIPIAVLLVAFFFLFWRRDQNRSREVGRDPARKNVHEAPNPARPRHPGGDDDRG